jgi:hypothetical protein
MRIEEGPVPALRAVTQTPWLMLVLVFGLVALAFPITFLVTQIDLPLRPLARVDPRAAILLMLVGVVWLSTLAIAPDVWVPRAKARLTTSAAKVRRVPQWRRPRPGERSIRRWALIQSMPFTRQHLYDAHLRGQFRLAIAIWLVPPAVLVAATEGFGTTLAFLFFGTMMALIAATVLAYSLERPLVSRRPSLGRGAAKAALLAAWWVGAFATAIMMLGALASLVTQSNLTWAVTLFAVGTLAAAVAFALARKWLIESLVVVQRPYDGLEKFAGLLLGALLLLGAPLGALAAAIVL